MSCEFSFEPFDLPDDYVPTPEDLDTLGGDTLAYSSDELIGVMLTQDGEGRLIEPPGDDSGEVTPDLEW